MILSCYLNFPQYTHTFVPKAFLAGIWYPSPVFSTSALLSPTVTLPLSHQLLNARAEIQVWGCLSPKLFLLISVPSQGIPTSDDSVLIGGPPVSLMSLYPAALPLPLQQCYLEVPFVHQEASGSNFYKLEVWVSNWNKVMKAQMRTKILSWNHPVVHHCILKTVSVSVRVKESFSDTASCLITSRLKSSPWGVAHCFCHRQISQEKRVTKYRDSCAISNGEQLFPVPSEDQKGLSWSVKNLEWICVITYSVKVVRK